MVGDVFIRKVVLFTRAFKETDLLNRSHLSYPHPQKSMELFTNTELTDMLLIYELTEVNAREGYSKQPSSRKSSRVLGGREREVGGPGPSPGCPPSKLGWNRAKLSSCLLYGAQGHGQR
ncbi:hypothetical protein TNCV_3321841 [Trichonephila clavipes]|nr:hypothetical protein TNCV_3321841 [Trichonephila clavipes]